LAPQYYLFRSRASCSRKTLCPFPLPPNRVFENWTLLPNALFPPLSTRNDSSSTCLLLALFFLGKAPFHGIRARRQISFPVLRREFFRLFLHPPLFCFSSCLAAESVSFSLSQDNCSGFEPFLLPCFVLRNILPTLLFPGISFPPFFVLIKCGCPDCFFFPFQGFGAHTARLSSLAIR